MSLEISFNNTEEYKNIYDRVKKVIIDVLHVSEDEIKLEAHYVYDLGADSMDRVSLILEFEDEFGCEIPDVIAQELNTVGDTMEYIAQNLEKIAI